jgi:hypothetical protein
MASLNKCHHGPFEHGSRLGSDLHRKGRVVKAKGVGGPKGAGNVD